MKNSIKLLSVWWAKMFQFPGNLLLTENIDYLLPSHPEASSVISLWPNAVVYYIYDIWRSSGAEPNGKLGNIHIYMNI